MFIDYVKEDKGQASEGQYWDVHWGFERPRLKDLLSRMSKRDVLAVFFERNLPKSGKILEAGCGMAQYVAYLHERGFNISGLDFSKSTLDYVKSQFAELSLVEGDLRAMPFSDQTFQSIICLGAVEHFEEGPNAILRELRRVLKKDGVLYVSVPYESLTFRFFNWLGRRFDAAPAAQSSKRFYQYRYRRNEFREILRQSGFKINGISFYGGIEGMKRRWVFLKHLLGINSQGSKNGSNSVAPGAVAAVEKSSVKSVLRDFFPLIWLLETRFPMFAHMIMFAATPDKKSR